MPPLMLMRSCCQPCTAFLHACFPLVQAPQPFSIYDVFFWRDAPDWYHKTFLSAGFGLSYLILKQYMNRHAHANTFGTHLTSTALSTCSPGGQLACWHRSLFTHLVLFSLCVLHIHHPPLSPRCRHELEVFLPPRARVLPENMRRGYRNTQMFKQALWKVGRETTTIAGAAGIPPLPPPPPFEPALAGLGWHSTHRGHQVAV